MYLKLLKNSDQYIDKEDHPFYAYISISNLCNANCVFCNVHDETVKRSTVNLYDLIYELKGMGIKYIHFTGGGEPFANPDIWQYIDLITKLDMKLAFTTNGGCLDEATVNKLTCSSLDYIFFSLDSHLASVHNSLRNSPGIWENATKAINLMKNNKPTVRIVINHLLNSQNIEAVNNMIFLKKKVNYDFLNLLLIKDCPELDFTEQQKVNYRHNLTDLNRLAKEAEVTFLYDDIDFFTDRRNRMPQSYIQHNCPCYFSRSAIYVDCPSGNIYPCDCTVHRDKNAYSYGNVRQQNLELIWKGEKREQLKQQLEAGQMSCKLCCDYANNYYNTHYMSG